MILKKLLLDQSRQIDCNDEKTLRELMVPSIVTIEMLEIVAGNPNNISIWLGSEDQSLEQVRRWHRRKMLFQNNIYCLDTREWEDFRFNTKEFFLIKAESSDRDEQFRITLYCSIDKNDRVHQSIQYL